MYDAVKMMMIITIMYDAMIIMMMIIIIFIMRRRISRISIFEEAQCYMITESEL